MQRARRMVTDDRKRRSQRQCINERKDGGVPLVRRERAYIKYVLFGGCVWHVSVSCGQFKLSGMLGRGLSELDYAYIGPGSGNLRQRKQF